MVVEASGSSALRGARFTLKRLKQYMHLAGGANPCAGVVPRHPPRLSMGYPAAQYASAEDQPAHGLASPAEHSETLGQQMFGSQLEVRVGHLGVVQVRTTLTNGSASS